MTIQQTIENLVTNGRGFGPHKHSSESIPEDLGELQGITAQKKLEAMDYQSAVQNDDLSKLPGYRPATKDSTASQIRKQVTSRGQFEEAKGYFTVPKTDDWVSLQIKLGAMEENDGTLGSDFWNLRHLQLSSINPYSEAVQQKKLVLGAAALALLEHADKPETQRDEIALRNMYNAARFTVGDNRFKQLFNDTEVFTDVINDGISAYNKDLKENFLGYISIQNSEKKLLNLISNFNKPKNSIKPLDSYISSGLR